MTSAAAHHLAFMAFVDTTTSSMRVSWPSWPVTLAAYFMAFGAAAFMARRFIAAFFFITFLAGAAFMARRFMAAIFFMAFGAAAFIARRFMAAIFFMAFGAAAFMAQRFIAAIFFMALGAAAFMARRFIAAIFFMTLAAFIAFMALAIAGSKESRRGMR